MCYVALDYTKIFKNMKSETTSSIEVLCYNCGFSDSIEVPKLTLLEDFECPECKHKELRKKLKASRILPGTEN